VFYASEICSILVESRERAPGTDGCLPVHRSQGSGASSFSSALSCRGRPLLEKADALAVQRKCWIVLDP
jgi:hypothetical protein